LCQESVNVAELFRTHVVFKPLQPIDTFLGEELR